MVLQTTLSAAAAAALIAIWLATRVGLVRAATRIPHGDAGNPLLLKRMRAQANYVEYTPFVLILIGLIEASGRGGLWLAIVAAVYFLARVLHALGMDHDVARNGLRGAGIAVTLLTLLGLGIDAVLIAAGVA
ncbi:MAG TPA: MAPEG family protein [Sphingomonadaceae bacterium]